ncbi:hypothetical protein MLD38_006179 [Melastoma candidum]|uniref:Uncharacterized protein n=1 Tax=Melastoma candidum TaxID=119954 RepID=A0ACB9RNC9_9MYRT|nr:hypothetical protein MLD38_006179 [Melastoma candidum]
MVTRMAGRRRGGLVDDEDDEGWLVDDEDDEGWLVDDEDDESWPWNDYITVKPGATGGLIVLELLVGGDEVPLIRMDIE